ncbi:EAL domain-containing protein [Bordetella holmesii]|uniref:Cyclic diguanylate phosphodiesterase (EAL) domain protein n=1 Tax=Bordetella holmesii CDC-H585-BH TaxID=1331206 RepID=A0A158M7J9_9BORD|nr:EAL domain-containing protein [Bordetella holmesii]AMD47392.1 diguanylate phosphodiesterase [Bordetella holmesii H558]KAK81933.1 cyclic diguanylate phosphodiesterase (EAL) domain protein [Bordetella holmesii CDC-H572-BH]KAK97690.1 cyclic diguanylate phosphodiesterase (EAL) domain protein [Bordetella holmesii CDC-H585-BH]KCV00970.1 cyclic diguanylate phosphodiesterase (EAL) domain protein [Bordetella holmesii CDC-H719-BH]KCV10604.1 cyclic diguanylate phosphodiesterase (EAL) domain protein [B
MLDSETPAANLPWLIQRRLLKARYQPVADLSQGKIYGHESLIRGPADSPLHLPDVLFAEASRLGLRDELEWESFRAGAANYLRLGGQGKLFLNLSGATILAYWSRWGRDLPRRLQGDSGLPANRIVIELTDHRPEREDTHTLRQALDCLREAGMKLALDDYGVGHASLQLWLELRPDLVKIDRYFFRDISRDENRLSLVRGMLGVAQQLGTAVVAEGIETQDDLLTIADLGIRYAQGWCLGYPDTEPARCLPEELSAMLPAVPRATQTIGSGRTALHLRTEGPAVYLSRHSNDDVHRIFQEQRHQHALAVLDEHDRPVGIINRRDFLEHYSERYTRDLFGRNRCDTFMNTEPVLVDISTSIDQLSHVLTSADQRYLTDGFIITRLGRYEGLGTGEALVRSVTEIRLEAARYANPLTSLPGNIPISKHIAQLLEGPNVFVIGYADLNNFKPFNDVYGYWRGDDMILLCAEIIRRHCDAQRDFVGHVGGDDFVIALRSPDWKDRLTRLIDEFNSRATSLYDAQARGAGGIRAEDRYGSLRFFPFVTLGIGALSVEPAALAEAGARTRPEDIASAAAHVKHKVKKGDLPMVLETYRPAI